MSEFIAVVEKEQINAQHPVPVVELGRAVLSPIYGKGFITDIEEGVVTVRFSKCGEKKFCRPEGGYPFEILDKVRPYKKQSIVEKILDRGTALEKKELALNCEHGNKETLCRRCAGVSDIDYKALKRHITKERRIASRGSYRREYVPVKIARNDCFGVSRAAGAQARNHECVNCHEAMEIVPGKKEPRCPKCAGPMAPIPEQFSRYPGITIQNYEGSETTQRGPYSEEAETARELFNDPNSRFQKGGVGHLRIPAAAARNTRADAPEWLDYRQVFIATLKPSRAARAEVILAGFYLENQTDTEIGQILDWAKDSVKKERAILLKQGNAFYAARSARRFRMAAKRPLRAAYKGRTKISAHNENPA
jgi:hypothetical protein